MGLKESLKESFKYACTPKEPTKKTSAIIDVGDRTTVEPPPPSDAIAPRICPTCGHTGTGRVVNKGHFLIELAIWLTALNYFFFVAPVIIAIAFSIWRRSYRNCHCYECGGLMIPTSSPRGKTLLNQYHSN